MLKLFKQFLFATYESDRKLFKIRNRILLAFALYAGFEFINTNPAINLSAAEQEQTRIITEETQNNNIRQEKVSIEEIKNILNKSSNVNVEESIVQNDFKQNVKSDRYIILLLTTKKSENIDSFKEKYSMLDIKEIITDSGDKLLFTGPYEGFSLAKKQLAEQKNSLPADSYVIKYVY